MGAAYSNDLRERVLRAALSGAYTRDEVAETFEVSVSCVDKLLKRFRTTETYEAKVWRPGPKRTLAPHAGWLREQVAQTPDATLEELCAQARQEKNIQVSPSMMCRELAVLDLPRKKSRFTTASATHPECKACGNNSSSTP
jgi:transposase